MSFSAGTTFVFGSWICEADGDGKLHTRLREEKGFDDKIDPVEEELANKMMSSPARTGEEEGYETDSEKEMRSSSYSDPIFKIKEPNLIELGDSADIVKKYEPCRLHPHPGKSSDMLAGTIQHGINLPTLHRRQHEGGKKNTPGAGRSARRDDDDSNASAQNCAVHWPSSFTENKAKFSDHHKELPFQEGKELGSSSEATDNSSKQRSDRQIKKTWRKENTLFIWQNHQNQLWNRHRSPT